VPDQNDVLRIALSLPDARADDDEFSFRVSGRQFVHAWRERIDPKKAKVPNPGVVVVSVGDEMDKQTLLASGDPAIFTESHYDGWPSILVRISDVDPGFLEKLITDSYDISVAKGTPKPRRR
jgi:hypothetical protein